MFTGQFGGTGDYLNDFIGHAGRGEQKQVAELLQKNPNIGSGTLQQGIDQNGRNGTNALYEACQAGHKAVVELLLQYGANPTTPSNNKKLPHNVASSDAIKGLLDDALVARQQNMVFH